MPVLKYSLYCKFRPYSRPLIILILLFIPNDTIIAMRYGRPTIIWPIPTSKDNNLTLICMIRYYVIGT